MKLKMYMLFSVACFVKWMALAYQPIARFFARKSDLKLKERNLKPSVSGLLGLHMMFFKQVPQ